MEKNHKSREPRILLEMAFWLIKVLNPIVKDSSVEEALRNIQKRSSNKYFQYVHLAVTSNIV